MQQSIDNAAASGEAVKQERKHHERVLLVEDSDCIQTTAEAIKSWMDVDVDMAENGRIACIMAMISLAEGRPYNVVLADMQKPEGCGRETVEWLRRNGWQGLIVAIGEDVSDDDRKRYVLIGCDDFVARPLDDQKLLAMFGRLANRSEQIVLAAAAEGEIPNAAVVERMMRDTPALRDDTVSGDRKNVKPAGRVLVVEDALCVQMIVGAFLQKMNFDVDTADNGRSACEMAVQSLENGQPYDVILMDIQLPKMNGKKAAKWLRDNGWKGPIIAASIHATDRNREEFLKAGCDSYIPKPITEASLRSALSECLQQG
jgi:CheY-like chemotaxis protein